MAAVGGGVVCGLPRIGTEIASIDETSEPPVDCQGLFCLLAAVNAPLIALEGQAARQAG